DSLEVALRSTPNDAGLLYDLALAHYGIGQTENAVSEMTKALAIGLPQPLAQPAKTFVDLVTAYGDPGKIPPASTTAQEVLKTNADYIPALMVSAAATEQKKQYESARKTFEKVLKLAPDFDPVVRDLVVLLGEHELDDSLASTLARKALAAYPDDARLVKALG